MIKFFLYLKKYWGVVVAVVGGVLAMLFLNNKNDSVTERLERLQKAHDEELKKIQDAINVERKQHEENVRKLSETLSAVQKQYEEQNKALDNKKKAQIEELVKNHGNDPEELAKKLSEATGFSVILPSD